MPSLGTELAATDLALLNQVLAADNRCLSTDLDS